MQTHYPDYNVMDQIESWDDHTREIVKKRLEPIHHFRYLTPEQVKVTESVAAVLIDEGREQILDYIIKHIDESLNRNIGESQRKAGTPPLSDLLKKGLLAIEITAHNQYQNSFSELSLVQRQALLGQIEKEEFPNTKPWDNIPQQEFFSKLLSIIVEAYYSHPMVWSEIGYGGPAYPRGYVRSELNLVDPWEARREPVISCEKE